MTTATQMRDRTDDAPFPDVADFLLAVRRAALQPAAIEPRLRAQMTTLGDTGGFAIPASLLDSLTAQMLAEQPLLSLVTRRVVRQGATYEGLLPGETGRTDEARHGGLNAAVAAEGFVRPLTATAVRRVTLGLHAIGALVPATNELVEDGSDGWSQDLEAIAAAELSWQLARFILVGSGVGEGLGLIHAPGTQSIAIEGTQSIANTPDFLFRNAAALLRQLRRPHAAVYLMHPDLWHDALTATTGAPVNGAAGIVGPATRPGSVGTLHQRDVYLCEHLPAPGTPGDMLCADLSRVLLVTKGADMRRAISPHVEFDRDRTLFRFTVRANAQPMLGAAIAPYTGTRARSDATLLAARS
jgi:HK97 family phage major capsid protein